MNKEEALRDLLKRITEVKVSDVSDKEISYSIPSGDNSLMPEDVQMQGTMDTRTMLEHALILTKTHGMLEFVDRRLERYDPDNTKIVVDPKVIANILDLTVDSASEKEIAYTLADGTKETMRPEVAAERALMYLCTPPLLEKVEDKLRGSTPGQMGE